MNIVFHREELADALCGLAKIVPRRATLPVLGAVRIDATPGGSSLSATDLEEHVRYALTRATVEESGTVLVPLTDLQELLKAAGRASITLIASSPDNVIARYMLAGQSMQRNLGALDPADWPASPGNVPTAPVDAAFLPLYRKAAPFAAKDPTRLVLNGVYLDPSDGGDFLVATDGRRLSAFNTITLPQRTACIVPVTKFLLWPKLSAPELAIGCSSQEESGWFRLLAGPWNYTCRTTAGTYPNWRMVVPGEPGPFGITLHDEDAALLARVLPSFAGSSTSGAAVTFRGQGGKLTISGQGEHDAEPSVLELPGSRLEGGTARITLDRWYLLEALAAGFQSFSFSDERSPLVARTEHGLHVLMPQRAVPEPETAEVTEEAPASVPAAVKVESTEHQKKEEPSMSKPNRVVVENAMPQGSALERVLSAYEQAKAKVREANEALAGVAVAVREALREDKQRRAEVETVRAGLARLQSIKV